jgi:hypothetical protein
MLTKTMTNGAAVPLFSGAEDAEDLFLSSMELLDGDPAQQIAIPYPLWRYLEDSNLIEKRGTISDRVTKKLIDKENPTVKMMTHYDDLDLIPAEALSEAVFTYGHAVGTQMYSREEMVKNTGEHQLVDLIDTKRKQLEIGMKNKVGEQFMGSQDADGRTWMGLGRALAYGQACGGINPATAGFAYWNPQRGLKKGTSTQYKLATEFRDGHRRMSRLCSYRLQEQVDVVVCGEDVYDQYQAWAENILRLSIDDLKSQKGWGDFEMFPMNGRTIIYDDNLDAKMAWWLNFKSGVKVRAHSGSFFTYDPWQPVSGKAAKSRNCFLYLCVYVENRDVSGVIEYL